jgi:dTDP-4-amino-4,6-dideoxygalactose transaminase
VLRVKLARLADWNQQRRQHAATYDRMFAASGLTSTSNSNSNETSNINTQQTPTRASGQTPVRLLSRSPQAKHVFHQYVIRAQRRDELRKFLSDRKIGTEVYYPLPLHLQPAFSYLGLKEGDLPVSEQAAKEVLALPMFPELTEAEIGHVVDTIAGFYSR